MAKIPGREQARRVSAGARARTADALDRSLDRIFDEPFEVPDAETATRLLTGDQRPPTSALGRYLEGQAMVRIAAQVAKAAGRSRTASGGREGRRGAGNDRRRHRCRRGGECSRDHRRWGGDEHGDIRRGRGARGRGGRHRHQDQPDGQTWRDRPARSRVVSRVPRPNGARAPREVDAASARDRGVHRSTPVGRLSLLGLTGWGGGRRPMDPGCCIHPE